MSVEMDKEILTKLRGRMAGQDGSLIIESWPEESREAARMIEFYQMTS